MPLHPRNLQLQVHLPASQPGSCLTDLRAQSPGCREHGVALRAALAGGLLQLVGTDHAVFNSTQKAVGRHDFRIIPNGVNGLEVGR